MDFSTRSRRASWAACSTTSQWNCSDARCRGRRRRRLAFLSRRGPRMWSRRGAVDTYAHAGDSRAAWHVCREVYSLNRSWPTSLRLPLHASRYATAADVRLSVARAPPVLDRRRREGAERLEASSLTSARARPSASGDSSPTSCGDQLPRRNPRACRGVAEVARAAKRVAGRCEVAARRERRLGRVQLAARQPLRRRRAVEPGERRGAARRRGLQAHVLGVVVGAQLKPVLDEQLGVGLQPYGTRISAPSAASCGARSTTSRRPPQSARAARRHRHKRVRRGRLGR